MAWHDRVETRETLGDATELLFESEWRCHCGAVFVHQRGPVPDFVCPGCGQLVDVKSLTSDDAIAISQIPFDGYPNSLIIAIYNGGDWIGCRRGDCLVKSGPHEPAHRARATRYYWVRLRTFRALECLLLRE